MNLQVHFKFAFDILSPSTCHMKSFSYKIFKTDQTEVTSNMKYLHDIGGGDRSKVVGRI